MTRQVCFVLHDVAPATWPHCLRLLALLEEFGSLPITFLVVPDFHGNGRVENDADFRRAIELRLRRGDELALHGYDHRDHAPPPRDPLDWVRRRLLTASEGEFAALCESHARDKLRAGLEMFARMNWPVAGFVPPAWLASAGTRVALRHSGLRYTSTHAGLIDLSSQQRLLAPCITASPRSMWRRVASRAWMPLASGLVATASVVRIGLHPADAAHADVMDCWRDVLQRLLRQREAVTKSRALFKSKKTIAHLA